MRVAALPVSLGYRSRLVSSVKPWFDLDTLAMRVVPLPVSLGYGPRLVSSVEQWSFDLDTLAKRVVPLRLSWVPFSTCFECRAVIV